MIVGHSLLAFTVVAGAATLFNLDREEALQLGAIAAAFALLPDVDVFYALKGFAALFSSGLSGFVESFWTASRETHRGFTHSIVTGIGASLFFSAYYRSRNYRSFAVLAALSILAAVAFRGFLASAVVGFYLAAGLLISHVSLELSDAEPRKFLYAILFGLISHPFGDVFTGTPPDFLFPLPYSLLSRRILLSPDPVINLLAVLSIEVLLGWTALLVFTRLNGKEVYEHVSPAVFLGVLAAGLEGVISPPTVDSAYRFVYPVLGSGFLISGAINATRYRELRTDFDAVLSLAVNLLGFTTVSVAAYLMAFLV